MRWWVFLFLVNSLEIHRKIQSKYSIELEQEAREWIESVIGEPLPSDDFHESLKDGIILCKWVFFIKLFSLCIYKCKAMHTMASNYLLLRMIGKLVPGEGKYKDSKIPFMQVTIHYCFFFSLSSHFIIMLSYLDDVSVALFFANIINLYITFIRWKIFPSSLLEQRSWVYQSMTCFKLLIYMKRKIWHR